MNCSICKDKINDKYGHNAEPINNGKCCSTCNHKYVIPERMRIAFNLECG